MTHSRYTLDELREMQHGISGDVIESAPALLDQLIETMVQLEADRWGRVDERLPDNQES